MKTVVTLGAVVPLLLSCTLPDAGRRDDEPAQQPATAQQPAALTARAIPLEARFQGAEQILVGTVERVSAGFERNAYGDNLIMSTVTLQVDESLRGDAGTSASFLLEGGTIGDLTLEVSDMPRLAPGDRGVFALRRSPLGRWVPNRRALGILRADAQIDLEAVRHAARVD